MRVSTRMSPGPWWGFNGVNTLELREGLFFHWFYVVGHGYVARVYELAGVQVESHSVSTSMERERTRLVLRLDGRRHLFTGRTPDSEALAEALLATV